MIEDILKEIVDLESEQADKVRQSAVDAKEIIASAKIKATQIADSASDEIKELSNKNVQTAEATAKAECDKIIAEANADAKNILQQAENKNKIVVNDIIGRLNARYA